MNKWDFNSALELFRDRGCGELLTRGQWGLEKESLRINQDGTLALTPHPEVFGSKLENPHITTDFSESQLELITPPLPSVKEALECLRRLQSDAEKAIGEELLWPLSMPGALPDEDLIAPACYGMSEEGRKKEIYRKGLALRYGKKMQMISGIHFNFSFHRDFWKLLHRNFDPSSDLQTFINEASFSMARNFLRYRWLLIYLFGASPTADHLYLQDQTGEFNRIRRRYCSAGPSGAGKEIVSLRMSSLGYRNRHQQNFSVSCNSLEEHIKDLRILMNTESGHFRSLGLYSGSEQIQLNDRLLQMENEYYSQIRFKQICEEGETQLEALEKRGIEYIEIRSFDLNPFEKAGIGHEQLLFTQLFMLFCLFQQSPFLTAAETATADRNCEKTALFGRNRETELTGPDSTETGLKLYAQNILRKIRKIAIIADRWGQKSEYTEAADIQIAAAEDHSLLPSEKIISEMRKKGETHTEFGIRKALENRQEDHRHCSQGIKFTDQVFCSCDKNKICSSCCNYI